MKSVYSALILLVFTASNFAVQLPPMVSDQIRFDITQDILNRANRIHADFTTLYPTNGDIYTWSKNRAQNQQGANGKEWNKFDENLLTHLFDFLPANFARNCAARRWPNAGNRADTFGANGNGEQLKLTDQLEYAGELYQGKRYIYTPTVSRAFKKKP